MAFVVDALVALAWCFRDEATAATDALLQRVVEEDAAAPGLWFMETANALAMAERRGRITASTLRRSNALLQRLDCARTGGPRRSTFIVTCRPIEPVGGT